ncbi:MAG: tyrosyl-tRNA synthetase [Patescibacteria group bacterium]|nr:tyrosyl-tRNA synthetase [Patescibacteria group bacterium]
MVGMDKIITDEAKIEELLSRGVEDVFIKEELKKDLLSGKLLRVKLGVDPTGPKIHLGRAIQLRKLREFQKLGHQIIFIVGDFTAQIGDASDKLDKRPMLTRAKIDENLKDYKSQISKIIDVNKAEFVYNSSWLSKLSFEEVAKLAECFTVQQMLARRNFKDRYDSGVEISLREFLYPLMQGYDSVVVKADVELGGFDQLFNVKAGRVVQEFYGMQKQHIVVGTMLEGTDGRKMSTSWGNIITIVDEPFDMFGKLMSVHDELVVKYFTLCTDVSIKEIKEIEKSLKEGENPKEIKMRLATEVVTMYHSEKDASQAKKSWIETFQNKGVPDDVPTFTTTENKDLGDVLVENKIVTSKTDWRRLVKEGAITDAEGKTITDPKIKSYNVTLKIGKRRFAKIILT